MSNELSFGSSGWGGLTVAFVALLSPSTHCDIVIKPEGGGSCRGNDDDVVFFFFVFLLVVFCFFILGSNDACNDDDDGPASATVESLSFVVVAVTSNAPSNDFNDVGNRLRRWEDLL